MKDFVSFLLRGGLGAIIGSTILALLFSLYTSYFLILIVALTPVFLAIEGAFGMAVGLVCRVAAGDAHRLNGLVRVAIGTEMMCGALLALYLCQFINRSDDLTNFLLVDAFYFEFFLLVVSLAIGGVAALACPSQGGNSSTSPLAYRDRIRLYEAAVRPARDKFRAKRLGAI